MPSRRLSLIALGALLLAGCGSTPSKAPATPVASVTVPPPAPRHIRIGLALGGGAARGFAHIGVIKVLEANAIRPDFVVGTSAVAFVGALDASGCHLCASGGTGFQLQNIALQIKEDDLTDWTLPDRGFLKGEAVQDFV